MKVRLFVFAAVLLTAFGLTYWLEIGHGYSPASRDGHASQRATTEELDAASKTLVDSVMQETTSAAESLRAELGSLDGDAETTPKKHDASPTEPPPTEIPSDWLNLPRNKASLKLLLVSLYGAVRSDYLFRHELLNPHDIYIDATQRDMLKAVLDSLAPQIEKLRDLHRDLAMREATSLRGSVPSVRVEPRIKEHEIDGEKKLGATIPVSVPGNPGLHVFLGNEDGSIEAIPHRELPMTTRLREAKQFLAVEISFAVIEWFRIRGLCSSNEAASLQAELAEAAADIHGK